MLGFHQPMNQDSYWYGYLMARHETFLIVGVIFMAMTLASALTGVSFEKYQGFVFREDDPKKFRRGIVAGFLLGLVSLGLYVYTFN
jgi:hypothetical protein